MDPDISRETIFRLADKILQDLDRGHELDPDEVSLLAESALALDSWISTGGWLPADWQRVSL